VTLLLLLLSASSSGVRGVVQPEVSSLMARKRKSGGRWVGGEDERGGRCMGERCMRRRYRVGSVQVRKG
jgi:hypothetical protein